MELIFKTHSGMIITTVVILTGDRAERIVHYWKEASQHSVVACVDIKKNYEVVATFYEEDLPHLEYLLSNV